jgi:hypothetical protein
MTEEFVTKAILIWLESLGWKIICFDFPQSGTGVSLHINSDLRVGKNQKVIIPDIIAYKNQRVLFLENKDRFVFNDFIKLEMIKNQGNYSESLEKLLLNHQHLEIYYGVGMPYSVKNIQNTLHNVEKIDFALFVNSDRSIAVEYEMELIF